MNKELHGRVVEFSHGQWIDGRPMVAYTIKFSNGLTVTADLILHGIEIREDQTGHESVISEVRRRLAAIADPNIPIEPLG